MNYKKERYKKIQLVICFIILLISITSYNLQQKSNKINNENLQYIESIPFDHIRNNISQDVKFTINKESDSEKEFCYYDRIHMRLYFITVENENNHSIIKKHSFKYFFENDL